MEFFKFEDNVLDKNLLQVLNDFEFTKRSKLSTLKKEITQIVAEHFTDGNKIEAKQLLDGKESMSKHDASIISYFTGAITLTIFSFIFFVFDHNKDIRKLED